MMLIPEREIQSAAELIFRWLQALPMRDAVAAHMMAQAALIWTQRPPDEATVRKMLAEYAEGVVELWKAQAERKP